MEGGGPELLLLRAGDVATVGRDPANRVQLAHGSIEPFHARLRCDEWGVWIAVVAGAGARVSGEAVVEERLVAMGATVELGALRFQLAAHEAPVATSHASSWHRRLEPWIDRAIGYFISAVAHAAVFWLIHRMAAPVVSDEPSEPIHLGFTRDVAAAGAGASEAVLPPRTGPEALPDLPAEFEPLPELPPFDATPTLAGDPLLEGSGSDFDLGGMPGNIGVGHSGVGGGTAGNGHGGGGGGMQGVGSLVLGDGGGVGGAVITRLNSLRGAGVDLVLVIDTTSSMEPFLDGARKAADSLIATLATLIGDLRVGAVAYRDERDLYVTRTLPLTADRYAVLNFLWSLRAEGGGDIPESISAGLGEAIERACWRPRRHHVVVVIGDAPPHRSEWSRIKSQIASFVRGDPKRIPGAVVSAIYTGPPREEVRVAEEDGATALAEIAKLGRGDYLDLGSYAQVGERLVWTILGPHHADELRVLMSRVREGPREAVVRAKAAEGDKQWLMSKLRRAPVHPLIVESLLSLADGPVLWEARVICLDPTTPREVREAAHYLLRRVIPQAGELDLDLTVEQQRPAVQRLDANILRAR